MGLLEALWAIIFTWACRIGQNQKFDLKDLIHTLELKLWHFEVFPYVYIGKPLQFAMFTHMRYVRGVATCTHKCDDYYLFAQIAL